MPFKLLMPQPADSLRAAGEGLWWLEVAWLKTVIQKVAYNTDRFENSG